MKTVKVITFLFAMGYLAQLIARSEINPNSVAIWEKIAGLVIIIVVIVLTLIRGR
jgi:hypothetical protein